MRPDAAMTPLRITGDPGYSIHAVEACDEGRTAIDRRPTTHLLHDLILPIVAGLGCFHDGADKFPGEPTPITLSRRTVIDVLEVR